MRFTQYVHQLRFLAPEAIVWLLLLRVIMYQNLICQLSQQGFFYADLHKANALSLIGPERGTKPIPQAGWD